MTEPIKPITGFTKIGMNRIEKELIRFKNFMDEIGEEFFLVAGLCLGLVRDRALIKYDKDFDFGVMGTECLHRIKEADERFYKYYDAVHFRNRDPKAGRILWLKKFFDNEKYGLSIEVQAHYIKGDRVYYNRNLRNWKVAWKGKGKCVWPKRLFDKFEKVKFAGVEFDVPSPPEEFLTIHYGKDWRTPKEYTDWRYHCKNLSAGHL